MKFFSILLFVFFFSASAFAQQAVFENKAKRQKINFNAHWGYLENDVPLEKLPAFSGQFQPVDLPHTWNRFDITDLIPGYRRAASWYVKELFVPEKNENLRYLLCFEGANITTQVFVNQHPAGKHTGGYIGFEIDISPFLKKGKNTLQVRVDNSYNPHIIPSQKSDFHISGGIIRDVWLKILPQTAIKKIAVSTQEVSHKKAKTRLDVKLWQSPNAGKLALKAQIKAPGGEIVAKKQQKIRENDKKAYEIVLPDIKKPLLWSPDKPNLYTVEVILLDNGKPTDRLSTKTGYRFFEFKEKGGFYLNGERLLIRGTHRHEDHAGYGAALPNEIHRRDMQQIKDMGANFVRLAHYPQDPEVYKACNELGLLVWDELPWCRGGMGGEQWKNNTRAMLKEIIAQNRNHPCIIMWSLGNELDWGADFPGGSQKDSLRAFLSELNQIAHQLDPRRVTCMRRFSKAADIVDVFSPSIWAGWYHGVYTNYEKALNHSIGKFDRFVHMEYGGASLPGRHTETPISGEGFKNKEGWAEQENLVKIENIASNGDWSENYIVDLFDWHLHITENHDSFAGNAQWAFKDFSTPLRPANAIPYINQKGLCDRAGKPKDAFFVFKSYWTENPKFAYIESHTWKHRYGAQGEKREVCVYSNCEEVELFLNNKSQGKLRRDRQKFPAQGLQWFVPFAKGKNTLKAVGFENGKQVTLDSLSLTYHTEKNRRASRIELSSRKLENGNILIEARIVDWDGRLCLDYNERINFSLTNAVGKLLINYGTPTRSQSIETANGYAAIEYVPAENGTGIVEAISQHFKGAFIEVKK